MARQTPVSFKYTCTFITQGAGRQYTSWGYGQKFEAVTLYGSFININQLGNNKLQCN